MNNDRSVLNYCPNYNKIVNFDFQEDDLISHKLITIYKNYVFGININNREDVDRIGKLDRVINSYIDDYLFRNELQKEILTVRVQKDNNMLKNLADIIIKIFTNYEEYTTRKIYISRWI